MAKAVVAITSMGVVSPVGRDLNAFSDSLGSVRTGIGGVRRFDPGGLKTREAGECDLPGVIADLGISSIHPSWSAVPIVLADNPKLAFAIHASLQALLPKGLPVSSGPSAIPPSLISGLAIYGTTGLEEVRHERLSEPLFPETHLCEELPPAFIVEALADFIGAMEVPPVSVGSACSASTQAIGEAFRAVAAGRVARALAGGFDSMIFPFGMNAFSSIGALCESGPDGAALKPFDETRAGTLLGEGAAMFLMEPVEAALEAGRVPIALITGYASSLDGYHQVKPHPSGEGAARAMKLAIRSADRGPEEIIAVNAHGSGTHSNDLAEARAIHAVFEGSQSGPGVSSSKPYFGHLLTGAGAMELAVVVRGISEGILHPTPGLVKPDPSIPALDFVTGAPRKAGPGPCISNSFGLNGQNGVLVVEPWNGTR